jgi:cytochrome c556
MPYFKPLLLASAIAMSGVVAWADATNPAVIARQEAMKTIGGSMKTMAEMAKGATAFDADAANAALAAMAAAAAQVPALFEAEEDDPESEAKAEIWFTYDDFTAKAMQLQDAAANAVVTDAGSLGAAMGAVGGTCKSCHMAYKE